MTSIIVNILKVFEKFGLWEKGVELIGSWCFIFYQKHFDAKFYPLVTQDIDFLIPFPYKGEVHADLVSEFEKLGFKYSFKSNGAIYMWNSEIKIEFITSKKGKGNQNVIKIKPLSIQAESLRFVDILFLDPIYIKVEGVKVLVPSPASFCLHKILILDRRQKVDKRQKDLEQAVYSYEISNRNKLKTLFIGFSKSWQKTIIKNLETYKHLSPLLKEDIDQMVITLQTLINKKM